MTLSRSASLKIYDAAIGHGWNDIKLEDVLFSGVMRTIANVSSIEIERSHCVHVSQNKRAVLLTLFNEFKKKNRKP